MKEKACILIADDNMDNCAMMSALLGHVGFAVETARTVADAVRLAQDKECDLYVIDSYFTDARGTDLCRQIRALDPLAPVIFYSTAYGEAEAEAALQAGAHAYVVKPDIDGLLRTIARLLDQMGKGADRALFLFN
ncbi:MAG: response regulator [Blastocatellia bacterium]